MDVVVEIGVCAFCGVEGLIHEVQRHIDECHPDLFYTQSPDGAGPEAQTTPTPRPHPNGDGQGVLVGPCGTDNTDIDRPHAVNSYSEHEDVEPEQHVADWGDRATKLLINLYKQYKPLVETRAVKTQKKMWEMVRDGLSKYGYTYTRTQCESKWKGLERAYKNMLLNKHKTGRGRKTCAFQNEIGEVLNKRHSIFPTVTMGTGEPTTKEKLIEEAGFSKESQGHPEQDSDSQENNDSLLDDRESASPSPTPTTSAISRTSSRSLRGRSVAKELQELRKSIEERHDKKLKMEQKKFDQKNEIIAELKLKNQLLKQYLESNKTNDTTM